MAQKAQPIQIDITATNAFKGTYLFISIHNYADSTKIIYKIKDSIDNKGLKNDTEYIALGNYKADSSEGKADENIELKLMKKFVEISKKHAYYSKDSICFNNLANASYLHLLNKVTNTNTLALESTRPVNTHISDGINFVFIIKTLGHNRRVFVDSPTHKTNPILYNLIHQTLVIYRATPGKSLLDKKIAFEDY